MSNDERSLQRTTASVVSVNKSKLVLRNSNRVSFSESINKSLPPENEYEAPSSSSPTSRSSSSPALKRNTPILFSTNRGLHMRMTTSGSSSSSNNNNTTTNNQTSTKSSGGGSGSVGSMSRSRTTTTATTSTNSCYCIAFCDLERWSTNRANTVSLEDTFTIARPAVVPHSAATGSLASNSLRFLPQKTNSMRFKGYSRFDVE